MTKIEIAKELHNTLDKVKCEECPLDEICEKYFSDKNYCLCEELESVLKNESEDK